LFPSESQLPDPVLPHPSPPRSAGGRRTEGKAVQSRGKEQTRGLLMEICGWEWSAAVSDRRSSLPRRHHHRPHQILPERAGRLLQYNGISPRTLDLHLASTPARPPLHLRPAEPPEKDRVRPGLPWSTVRRGAVEREGFGVRMGASPSATPFSSILDEKFVDQRKAIIG
jgi:hypothetical protein